MKINYKRMLNNFIEMTKIEGPSYDEIRIQKYAEKKLKSLGCKVFVDNAGKAFKTTAKGNVIGHFPGTIKSAPFILAAHLDTVQPCKNIKAIVKGDKVTSDGTTILAADDRAGMAIIFEVLATLKASNADYPPVEVLFTLCEEVGMYGAKALDTKLLRGREGLILDSGDNSAFIYNAPASRSIEVNIKGIAAHAGVEPEKGISAIEVAAKAISMMKLGRIDSQTVANLGVVQGGLSTNVVMPELLIKGEARSRNIAKLKKQVAHMRDCFKRAEKLFTKKVDGRTVKPLISFKDNEKYPMLNIALNSALVKHIISCAKKHGVKMKPHSSGGGYDANVLCGKGFLMPIIGIGYGKVHSPNEWLDLKKYNQTADIVADIVVGYRK